MNPTDGKPVAVSSLDWDSSHWPDDGQLGQGHWGQFESVWKRDDIHPSGTLRRVVLQTLSHLLLFCGQEDKHKQGEALEMEIYCTSNQRDGRSCNLLMQNTIINKGASKFYINIFIMNLNYYFFLFPEPSFDLNTNWKWIQLRKLSFWALTLHNHLIIRAIRMTVLSIFLFIPLFITHLCLGRPHARTFFY